MKPQSKIKAKYSKVEKVTFIALLRVKFHTINYYIGKYRLLMIYFLCEYSKAGVNTNHCTAVDWLVSSSKLKDDCHLR